jgi:hypothetical protein
MPFDAWVFHHAEGAGEVALTTEAEIIGHPEQGGCPQHLASRDKNLDPLLRGTPYP